jgi:hypothetical protein
MDSGYRTKNRPGSLSQELPGRVLYCAGCMGDIVRDAPPALFVFALSVVPVTYRTTR